MTVGSMPSTETLQEPKEIPEECDVVIAGAGPAGCLAATKLAQAGREVVVLESGPAWNTSDLTSSQLYARRLRGPYVATTGEQPIAVGFNSGRGFGGAALHHYGVWPRLHTVDFKLQSLFGDGLDWPFEYHELRPFYDLIQAEVGISGDERAEVWRPPAAPYPMGPLTVLQQGEVARRGFDRLGVRTAPVPVAINSRPHRGRPACLYDAWCDAGCPIGALANPLVTYKPDAERAGARFFAGTRVESLISKHKDRVGGVRYSDVSGRARRLRAGLVIGAASPIGNTELLLRSADSLHPTGLGNERGLVGRYMMTHAAVVVYGMFAEETAPYLGISGGQLISHDDYRRGSDAGYQWLIAPATKPNDILGIGSSMPGVKGSKLTEFMRQGAHHLANMLSMAEAIPVACWQVPRRSVTTTSRTCIPNSHRRREASAAAAPDRAPATI